MKRLIIYLKLIYFLPLLLIPFSTVMACDLPSGGNDNPGPSDSGNVSTGNQSSGDNSDMFDICQFKEFRDRKECKEREGK
jgi:hypothetical protein